MLSKKTVDLFGRPTEICGWSDDLYFQTLDTQANDLALFAACLPSNGVVFDIGANIGLTAVAAAQAGNRVFAFEPGRRAFDALCANSQNRTITVSPVAIGERDGFVRFQEAEFLAGSHVVQQGGREVRAIRLDDWFAGPTVPTPNLVKIDVEGHEPEVLNGADQVLASGSLVIMEVNAFALDAFGRTSTTALLLDLLQRYQRLVHIADGKPAVISDLRGIQGLTHHLIAGNGVCWTDIAFCSEPKRIDELLARLS